MSQSRRHSALEALANVGFGFGISVLANLWVLPWFGYQVTARQSFEIGLIFTVISIVRSYVFRRFFNRFH